MNLEHDRCSELLGPLLRGELSEQEAITVEDHIAGCEECRAEKKGLEALVGAPEVMKVSAEPLSELERARLRKAIADAIPASRTIVSEAPKPFMARIAPYLSTAAVLILIVFGATQINLGGGDSDEAADGAATEERALEGGDEVTDTAGDGGAESFDAPAPGPSFDEDAGEIEPDNLRRFASSGAPFTDFAANYTTDDAEELDQDYLRALATSAEETGSATDLQDESRESDTITECGNSVLDALDDPTLPAYAAWGVLNKLDVLMMGFVYSSEDSGPLNKFMLWIWPRGDCSFPTEYQNGKIKP